MRHFAPLFALLALAPPLAAQHRDPTMDTGGPVPYDAASYDVKHYGIGLAVDPSTRSINGQTAVTATFVQPNNAFVLDLDTVLAVRSVRVDGAARPFVHTGGKLRIALAQTAQPGQTVRAEVDYGGTPRVAVRAPWDGGFTWGTTPSGMPWITTTVQGEGADLWFPCKDYPSDEADSVDLAITVPEPLVVATNGRLAGVDAVAGANGAPWRRYRWHVANRVNNYGLSLNIGPYVTVEDTYTSVTGEAVPFQFFVLPEREADARRQTPEFLRYVRFYEETLGPYPWRRDKLGVAHTPHLGMEHQTIIAYGSTFSPDADGFDWLYHHEYGHEYFGNLLTAWDWRDFWIHEGFDTYMQALYAEKLGGHEAYLRRLQRNSRFSNVIPVAPRDLRTSDQIYQLPGGGGNLDIYYKGAWVLHTLRYVMGDEAFFRALRRFVYPTPEAAQSPHPGRFVTTDDFVAVVNAEAGRDLTWFFDVYVRQPALPRLVTTSSGGEMRLRWDVPGNLPFPMPVEVQMGGQTRRVDVPAEGATLPLMRSAMPVDPNGWLLKAN